MLQQSQLLQEPQLDVFRASIFGMKKHYARLINKVRPLLAGGGLLIAVNNALFVSGAEYMDMLQALCARMAI